MWRGYWHTLTLLLRRSYESLGVRRLRQQPPLGSAIAQLRLHAISDLAEWFLVVPVARGFDHLPILTRCVHWESIL